ncbi:hypothetical protein TNCV_4686521 [Trichonephila clavipes]|nr:hypothetical protein TNCV_4686521 [Trichonephila clavipes]
MTVVIKTEGAECRHVTFTYLKILGRERGSPRGFKETNRKLTEIIRRSVNCDQELIMMEWMRLWGSHTTATDLRN